jgi:hypothetical protein
MRRTTQSRGSSRLAGDIQTQVFEVGKRHPFERLRGWFQALYEALAEL